MTNLLILAKTVIALSTNVVSTDNAEYEKVFAPCPDKRSGCLVIHGISNGALIRPATQRTEVSIVTEITSAEFEYAGRTWTEEISRKEVSRTQKTFSRFEGWKEIDAPPVVPRSAWLTNWVPNNFTIVTTTNSASGQ